MLFSIRSASEDDAAVAGEVPPLADWLTATIEEATAAASGAPSGDAQLVFGAYEVPKEGAGGPAAGAVLGAAQLRLRYGGLYVSLIAVRKDQRGRGIGGALLRTAEAAAAAASPHRAAVAYLAAFDFQASAFYPRVGYALDCSLPGWAHGISASFFSRPLEAAAASADSLHCDAERGFCVKRAEPGEPEAAALEAFLEETVQENELELMGAPDNFFTWALEAVEEPPSGAAPLPASSPPPRRLGGVAGASFWGGLLISQLAVEPAARRRGVGRGLVGAAVALAAERGCLLVVADALSCEAVGFWEAVGFTRFGSVRGLACGQELHRFVRRLTPAAAELP